MPDMNALNQQALLEISRQRADASRAFQTERDVVAHRRAAQGTLNDGGFLKDIEDLAERTFLKFATDATTDLVELAHLQFGHVGNEAAEWIRHSFESQVELLAIEFGQAVDALRVARKVPERIGLSTEWILRAREDREIRLGRLLLRVEFHRLAHEPQEPCLR